MTAIRVRVVGCGLVVSLGSGVGCTSAGLDLGEGTSTGGGETTTAAEPSTTSASSSSSSGALDESTTGEPGPASCHDPRPIPLSPFDCSGIDGVAPLSIIIEGDDDPSILAGLRRVEGSVRINRTSVTNLDFMGCLEEVAGDVTIYGNDALTNVDGLWKLRTIGTDFVFSSNDALVDFDGLPNVESMDGAIVMSDNASLEVISGFHSLVDLASDPFIDPFGQQAVGGDLWIRGNPVLRSMDGLGQLQELGGIFAVNHNPALCMSSVYCVASGLVVPETPPDDWTTVDNDPNC